MNPPSLFAQEYRALVIGASGAIGSAFVQALQQDARCVYVGQVARSDGSGFDLRDPASIAARAADCAAFGPYALVVDATGALTLNGIGPEKQLAAVQAEAMADQFALNAIGPLLALRHFGGLLDTGNAQGAIYAKLSARVGSIADNHTGGWYSYRASKAALNMLLQTAAIELQRKTPLLRVVALQPGTVRSTLSQPFAANVAHLLEPAQSVHGMLAALRSLPPRKGAHFVDYLGREVPW